jgi:hypothetical protein
MVEGKLLFCKVKKINDLLYGRPSLLCTQNDFNLCKLELMMPPYFDCINFRQLLPLMEVEENFEVFSADSVAKVVE